MEKKNLLVYMFNLTGGGAERTIVNIINNLSPKDYQVTLVLGSRLMNDYLELLNDNIVVEYLGVSNHKKAIRPLSKFIKKSRPDLIFSTININNIVMLLSNMLSFVFSPTIVREANNRTASGEVGIKNKIITFLTYNFMATKVIALSHGVKDDLVNNFHIKNKKITIIYNPVDIKHIHNQMNEDVEDKEIFRNKKTIVSIGKLGEQKDYPTLLKAFSVATEKLDANLLIIGKGVEENNLKKLCLELNIEKKVQFMGFQENPYKYLKKADLFVLSSRWEGFGHVIVEAMVVGTPVISTDCKSGPREILGDNEYGVLIPVGDWEEMGKNIVKVINNKSDNYEILLKARERAEIFNVKNIVQKYSNLFEETLVSKLLSKEK